MTKIRTSSPRLGKGTKEFKFVYLEKYLEFKRTTEHVIRTQLTVSDRQQDTIDDTLKKIKELNTKIAFAELKIKKIKKLAIGIGLLSVAAASLIILKLLQN